MQNQNKTCPCKFGYPCSDRCTCANPYSSHGCSRCCSYGSEQQKKDCSKAIAERQRLGEAAIKALKAIAELGGNLSDERLISVSGPNDGVSRAILYIGAREIARNTLEANYEQEEEQKTN